MKKILVVEDEYYARKSIVKILQESDLDLQVCGEAVNGIKAIELLEELFPKLHSVFIDASSLLDIM